MLVIPAMIGAPTTYEVMLVHEPSLDALRRCIEPHLEGQRLEHVSVLYQGERRDMFVGDESAGGILNLPATEIYWANARAAIAANPDVAARFPEPWPTVSGPAVLFPSRRVWF